MVQGTETMSANCNPSKPDGTRLTSRPISSQRWGQNPVPVREPHRSERRNGKPSASASEFYRRIKW